MSHTFTELLLRKIPVDAKNVPWKQAFNLIRWLQLGSSVDEMYLLMG